MNDWHWRDTALRPRFLIFDAIAAVPLLLLLMHWDMLMLYMVFAIMGGSYALDLAGLSFPVLLKMGMRMIKGRNRPPLSMCRSSRYMQVTYINYRTIERH